MDDFIAAADALWDESEARHLIVGTIRYATHVVWPSTRQLPAGWVAEYVVSIDNAFEAKDMCRLRERCAAYRAAVDALSAEPKAG